MSSLRAIWSAVLAISDHQLTAVSFVIALGALWIAAYGIRRSNENSSVATLVTLYDGLRQAWQRFFAAEEATHRQFELSELMNLVELACASQESLVGPSKELLVEYLEDSLQALLKNPEARTRIPAMFGAPDTFKYVRKFLLSRPELLKSWSALVKSPVQQPSN